MQWRYNVLFLCTGNSARSIMAEAILNGKGRPVFAGATGHSGEGILSRVTSIQRIHTEGGMPSDNKYCDAANAGKEVGTAYAADYYFYAPAR